MRRGLLLAAWIGAGGLAQAQDTVVDKMSELRALPVPSANPQEVKLRGYYQAGDNTPQTYRWDPASTDAPDGGAVVAPAPSPAAGRWLLVWDKVTANVRTWGAVPVPNVYQAGPESDSLPAINRAINALPVYELNDHSQSPGAAGTGHTRTGQLYFPTGQYAVSGEILLSAYLRVLGDGTPYTTIGFLPHTAPSASDPKWVIRYLYNQSAPNPNENFFTGIWGVGVTGLGTDNAGSCGMFFIGANGAYMVDCGADAALQPFKVDAKGVHLDRLITGFGCRGPGLELLGGNGAEISAGYLDIERVSVGSAAYPAVWIHDLSGFALDLVATESTPLSVRITNCFGGTIQSLHANPNPPDVLPAGSALVLIDGAADAISIASMSQSPTTIPVGVIDNSVPIDGDGQPRAVTYNPPLGRGSYFQKVTAHSGEFKTATAGTFYGSGSGLTDVPASSITGLPPGGERLIGHCLLTRDMARLDFAIPPGVHHLRLLANCKTTAPAECLLLARPNGESAPGDYSNQCQRIRGAAVSAGVATGATGLVVGAANAASAPWLGASEATISLESNQVGSEGAAHPFSAGALFHEAVFEVSAGQLASGSGAGRWAGGPRAVTGISVLPAAGSLVAGSTLYLYGY